MRIYSAQQVTHEADTPHGVTLTGSRGEVFRVDALEADIVRVQFRPDGDYRLNRTWTITDADGDMPREGRPRDDMGRFSGGGAVLTAGEGVHTLTTEHLRVDVHSGDVWLRWHTADGTPFAEDIANRAYQYDRTGQNVYHTLAMRDNEHYYGFGERSGPLDKRGHRMEMRNLDSLGYNARTTEPLYKHFPFYITFVPELNLAYGLFYDNLATTIFDMGCEIDAIWPPFRKYEAHGGDIDYYLIYGPTIADVVDKFTQLTGRPALPPRYTLGYLGSTMSYTEAPNAQQALKQFAELVREHRIPCDLFHLSSGYTTDANGNRCVFTWNRSRVPDPAGMVGSFHDANIRLAANVKPYLLTIHPNYDEVRAAGGFLKDPDDPTHPAVGMFWSGGARQKAPGSYLDLSSAAGYDWWQKGLQSALFDYGMDVIWNDNNEFEVWDDATPCDGFGDAVPIGLARPLLTLLMGHASYHATARNRPDERPFLLSRSGTVGIQRYAQVWSGDNDTSWETLRYNIPMGLGLGLSGAPNNGHDVGGFFGPKPEPELFVRWVQNGIFQPRFTIHSWNTDGTVNEPWMYPDYIDLVRAAIEFRYRLFPYLYSLFVESHHSGQPINRPMVYDFPQDPATHTESFDFLLGPSLLVPSVMEPGETTRQIYLPSGTGWYDWHSGAYHAGGQAVTLDAPLDRFPLLVREGGLVPMGKLMQYVGELPDDERTVYAFPHHESGTGSFTLYEDDGITAGGARTAVTLTLTAEPDALHLAVHIEGDYTLPYTALDVVLPPGENRKFASDNTVNEEIVDTQRVIHVFI